MRSSRKIVAKFVKISKHRLLALAFQLCVGKQRIAYNNNPSQGRVDPESASSPVISDKQGQ